MTLAVSSSLAGEDRLRRASELVRSELLELPSISQVRLLGTRDREISIELSEEELRRNGLSIAQVANTVQRVSLNLTFGELRTESGGVVLHTVSKRSVGEEFASIPLLTRLDGSIVTLGDVARIRDAFVDEDVVSRVNGVPTVLVRVEATERQSVVRMADDIRSWLEAYEPFGDVSVSVWNDPAEPALARLSGILRNGVIGAVLVLVLLVLVFDLRAAVWITVGIPFSFVATLMFFEPASLTLNLGTMIAFFLMIGLVVDDALVVGESIAAERESGKGALEAAVAGVKAVASPITIGACTTILAFLPFLFVTPAGYQLVNAFPYVAFFVLSVSLIEAFLILPAHLSHGGRWSHWPLSALQARVGAWIDEVRERTVMPAVSWSVRHIGLTLACGAGLVLFSLALVRTEAVRVILLDEQMNAPDYVQVELQLPFGTPFAATLAAAEDMADAAHALNEQLPGESVRAVSILAGYLVSSRATGHDLSGSHLGTVRVHLNDRPVRVVSPAEIERAWREQVGDVSHVEKLEFQTTRIPVRPTVAYALQHEDPEILSEAAAEMTAFLATIPGVFQISDSLAAGKRHLQIELTPAGVAAGLTPAAIGMQLRANFHGVEAQRIQRGHEEIKVMVRYPRERRRNLQELTTQRVRRAGGGEVPLSTVATLTEQRELATLTRIDGERAGLVNARADAAIITPIQARRRVDREFLPGLLDRFPGLQVKVEGGVRDEREMVQTMAMLVPVVLIAMYALMAAFLRSYWKPLVAVAGFPLSFAGAILGHWLLGWDLTAMSLFGIIAVFGVVVNDALVLLDRYNTIRQQYPMMPAIAAASTATRDRFRAVFLTSATTLVGLSPLLYERSDDLIFLVPFVVSMIGGVVLSGVFILFVLPTLVMTTEGRHD
ncbi:MAG: efflux RND transporter permease subunit [Bryobacterales bacterium]|nr:efflux RND transporter permease subunit [Bryobacterales bacterium]